MIPSSLRDTTNGAERDTTVTSFSVAESFISALTGIALAEGHVDSVNDPVTKYLPELAARDPQFSNITLRHLLMMSSGLTFTDYPFLTSDAALSYIILTFGAWPWRIPA